MEKISELDQELAEAERRATKLRLEALSNKIRMILTIEKESLEYLKEEVESTSEKLKVSEQRLSGERND
ncbi:MAG: hypothetical protein CMB45_06175 [Euryarchaeota archaeon]|nr:hypothetical protein [Euryarchaeota archaeon]|tara:strand:- start:10606 stop:10812 length:207 start_codon:yes stop_codon:yes gene_type:complete